MQVRFGLRVWIHLSIPTNLWFIAMHIDQISILGMIIDAVLIEKR